MGNFVPTRTPIVHAAIRRGLGIVTCGFALSVAFAFYSSMFPPRLAASVGHATARPPASPSLLAADSIEATPPAIVIGFVGGFIRHDDPVHSEVQLASRLRKDYPTGVDVETFENARFEVAHKRILRLLDTSHTGTLTPEEKKKARIILYGHSWGASAAVALADELDKDGIPVLLTVQVDSVPKYHADDTLIPSNVAQAVNFYQPDGLIHGESMIRAADPARTRIIGNFRSDYKDKQYACREYPWYDRVLTRNHTQIECDPNVWKQAEGLIQAALAKKTANDSSQAPAGPPEGGG